MKQVLRQWQIIRTLAQRASVRKKELVEMFAENERTIERDIKILSEIFDIRSEFRNGERVFSTNASTFKPLSNPPRYKKPKKRGVSGFPRVRFRRWRIAQGLSQACIGSRLGVNINTVTGWETGRENPSKPHHQALMAMMDGGNGPGFSAGRLKRFRLKHRLTQMELGQRLEVTSTTIANWENSRNFPDVANIRKILKLLAHYENPGFDPWTANAG